MHIRTQKPKKEPVEKLQEEHLTGPAQEPLEFVRAEMKEHDVEVVTAMPKAEWIIFRNQRDPGFPLDFHYSSKQVPFKIYHLVDGHKYLLPYEVIKNLEACREDVYKYRKNADGNPEIYISGYKSHFVCERAA